MKKIALILVLFLSFTFVFGQKNVRQTASNFFKNQQFDKALEAINQCLQDASTAQDAKTWFIRGNIYLGIATSTDSNIRKLDADPYTKAVESYKKSKEYDSGNDLNDDLFAKIDFIAKNYFSMGTKYFEQKEFLNAALAFEKTSDTYNAIGISDTISLGNAALCATKAMDNKVAKKLYQKMLDNKCRAVIIFSAMAEIYKDEKDSAKAIQIIRQGQKLYPNDFSLFLDETNIYLAFSDVEKALRNLNLAARKDSTNYLVFNALGSMYDRISSDSARSEQVRDEAYANSEASFKKAIAIKQDFFDAYINLGALYFNRGAIYQNMANKLPLEKSEEFKKLTDQANKYFELALPYIEKASEIDPNDLNTLMSLRQIYAIQAKKEKLAEVNKKISDLRMK